MNETTNNPRRPALVAGQGGDMMRTQRLGRAARLVVLVAAGLLSARGVARSEEGVAGAPGEWLSQYSSARTLGMGGAFVAAADDPMGVLWNPAALSALDQNELRFETARLFEQTSLNGFGFAVPGSRLPSIGLTLLSLRSGEFQRTNEMNDPLGTFREGEMAYLLTLSKAFSPRFAVGGNLKVVQQTVESFNGGGVGADIGAWYDVTPALRIGGSALNIGGPTIRLRKVDETYPMLQRFGAALRLFNGRARLSAELDHNEGDLGAQLRGGAEFWIQPSLGVRGGYGDSYGAGGLTYRFAPRYAFDYGFANQALGMTHRIGLSVRFGGFFASSAAEPQVFSPTGEHAVTKIALNARTKATPTTWVLEVRNKADELVRRFGGSGQPPAHIEWDGKDENGLPLPDGSYRYCLTVSDREGRMIAGPARAVEISTGGPMGSVPVIPVQ